MKKSHYQTLKIILAMGTILIADHCLAAGGVNLVEQVSVQTKGLLKSGLSQLQKEITALSLVGTIGSSAFTYFKTRELIDSLKNGAVLGGVLYMSVEIASSVLG